MAMRGCLTSSGSAPASSTGACSCTSQRTRTPGWPAPAETKQGAVGSVACTRRAELRHHWCHRSGSSTWMAPPRRRPSAPATKRTVQVPHSPIRPRSGVILALPGVAGAVSSIALPLRRVVSPRVPAGPGKYTRPNSRVPRDALVALVPRINSALAALPR